MRDDKKRTEKRQVDSDPDTSEDNSFDENMLREIEKHIKNDFTNSQASEKF